MLQSGFNTVLKNEVRKNHMFKHYFRAEECLYGEQLIGILFHPTQIGHDVVVTDSCRCGQHVLHQRVITVYLRDVVHFYGMRETLFISWKSGKSCRMIQPSLFEKCANFLII